MREGRPHSLRQHPRRADAPPAIVIALDCITGLQTARILARRGIPVVALAGNPSHFCCRTTVCDRIVHSPTSGEELIRALEELHPTLPRKAVLFPCSDLSVLAISRHRARLEPHYHLRLPAPEMVEALMDKLRFHELALKHGLPVPTMRILRSRSDAEEAAGELAFPCMLKPPVKTPLWQKNTGIKVYRVESAEDLLAVYDRCSPWADELMVQEWIEGGDEDLTSCNCYFNSASEPVVTFMARKLRQWPPETGTSCLGEECRNDEVLEVAMRLFRAVRYSGLGYLEMKRDRRTGRQYIIEPNIGRPTGRSAIAEAAGVELLYAKYCDIVGWPLPPNLEQGYRNTKWIYWRRDLQSAFYYWRKGKLTLREWLRSWRGLRFDAVFAWSDQRPFWADLFRVGVPFRRLRRKLLKWTRRAGAGGEPACSEVRPADASDFAAVEPSAREVLPR